MSVNLDANQAQHFVRPDLGPNYLQRLSIDNKSGHKPGKSYAFKMNVRYMYFI